MPAEDIEKQEPEAIGQHTSSKQHTQPPANPESVNTTETKPERTAELLSELVTLIRRANEPKESVSTPWTKIKKHFNAITETIKNYWVWLPIIGFLAAWWIYQFDPFYVFDQYKIASDESAAKIANIAHKKSALKYYINSAVVS